MCDNPDCSHVVIDIPISLVESTLDTLQKINSIDCELVIIGFPAAGGPTVVGGTLNPAELVALMIHLSVADAASVQRHVRETKGPRG